MDSHRISWSMSEGALKGIACVKRGLEGGSFPRGVFEEEGAILRGSVERVKVPPNLTAPPLPPIPAAVEPSTEE